MNVKPLVSIISITYNSEKFLRGTIESVLGQDYPRIEYIIIDGGSKDNTLKIVEEYKGRIAKIISEPDRGISDAMNKGIRLSTGEIIGIIHSDDYYAGSSVVSRVVKAFEGSPDIKVTYGIQDFVDPDTGAVLLSWGKGSEPAEIRKRMYLPHPTVFCRREVYEKAGLFREDYRYAMDYEWAMRVTRFTRPYFINHKLAVMRDMGSSGKNYRISLSEGARALRENGYYFDYLLTLGRNLVKIVLIELGLKDLLYKLWAKNVSKPS